jgi:hypothetical protein
MGTGGAAGRGMGFQGVVAARLLQNPKKFRTLTNGLAKFAQNRHCVLSVNDILARKVSFATASC